MRLKRLELYGYKSFASRCTFEFGEGITAIVGPNGSGKSNVADAMRWVMGEQSYRSLRARTTEDMIFAGTRSREPAGHGRGHRDAGQLGRLAAHRLYRGHRRRAAPTARARTSTS